MKTLATRVLLAVACAVCAARPAVAQLPPFEVLHEFADNYTQPGPLIEASDGNFYGTTSRGGDYDLGTIFRMTRDYHVSIVYTFSGLFDGGRPDGGLVQASDGSLYGTTSTNGAYNQGILFRFSLDGAFAILHAFNNALDARAPNGTLVQGADGYLYGTTTYGGAFDRGTVFRAALNGDVAVLHSFPGGADGTHPRNVIRASDGNFYGKTEGGSFGPSYGPGGVVLFRVTPGGQVTILRRLTSATNYGSGSTTLVQAADGHLYGNHGCGGTIFRLTLQGDFSTVAVVGARGGCGYDGGPPSVPLIAGADGFLYGVVTGLGELVVLSLDGAHNVIARPQFCGGGWCYLLQSINGHLYGTSVNGTSPNGGASSRGTVFRVTPRAGEVASASVSTAPGAAVRLKWAQVSNAASYTIRRRTSAGEIVAVSALQGLTFVDRSTIKGQRYHYVVTAVNAFGEGLGSYDLSITAGRAIPGDFDGDGAADAAVFRPSSGTWHIRGQSDAVSWGGNGDVPVAADYSGDGRIDIAVFRPSTGVWYIRGVGSVAWGGPGDIPVPGYYLGGTAADIAVYRPSNGTWYVRGIGAIGWGAPDDLPAPGDYDGDGLADVAVHRPAGGTWLVRHAAGTEELSGCGSTAPYRLVTPADYDGDGKTDRALFYYRSWDICSLGWADWGAVGDQPVPADYDSDGRADVAVFRESTGDWYILLTGPRTGVQFKWGGLGDIPIR